MQLSARPKDSEWVVRTAPKRHKQKPSSHLKKENWLTLRSYMPPKSLLASHDDWLERSMARTVIWEYLDSAAGAGLLNQVLQRNSPFHFEYDEATRKMTIRVYKQKCPDVLSFQPCFPGTRMAIHGLIPEGMKPCYPHLQKDLGVVYVAFKTFLGCEFLFEMEKLPFVADECIDVADVYALVDWLGEDLHGELYFDVVDENMVFPTEGPFKFVLEP
jgi:hypothetical protein